MAITLQAFPPSEEASYFLDCSVEANELDGCSAIALNLYGDREQLHEIVSYPDPPGVRRLAARQDVCRALADLADTILPHIEPERVGNLLYSGMVREKGRIVELAEIYAKWAITDETVGGSMEAFRYGRDIRIDRNGRVYKRTMRRLCSPSFVRRFLRYASDNERECGRRVFRRLPMVPRALILPGAWIWEEQRAQDHRSRERFRRFHREHEEASDLGIHGSANLYDRGPIVRLKPGVRRRIRAQRKVERRVLRRGVRVAESVLGRESTMALCRGQAVTLAGPTVAFEISPRTRLAKAGHGALAVAVKTHQGAPLAELCLYFKDTPAIDQAVAIALHAQAGLERELIEDGNIIGRHPEAIGHPLFAAKPVSRDVGPPEPPTDEQIEAELEGRGLSVRDRATIQRMIRAPDRYHHLSHEAQNARADAYWEKTRDIWIREVTDYHVGRDRLAREVLRGLDAGSRD